MLYLLFLHTSATHSNCKIGLVVPEYSGKLAKKDVYLNAFPLPIYIYIYSPLFLLYYLVSIIIQASLIFLY